MTTNYTRQDVILPNLQRAGEAAIDAAMPLLRSHRPGLPTESRQAFERIAQAGLIDLSDFARRLIALGTQQQTST
jgi:uncharacterized protein YutE (UPF0331/DUF86 family)